MTCQGFTIVGYSKEGMPTLIPYIATRFIGVVIRKVSSYPLS